MKKNEPRRIQQVVARRSPRRQSRQPRRKPEFSLGSLLRNARIFVWPAAILVSVLLLFAGYSALAGSRIFELQTVKVTTASPLLGAEIEQVIKRTVGESRLLSVDLEEIRKKIETLPRVRGATVGRSLPNSIHAYVVERTPVVLVRRSNKAIVWLDEEGTELGEFSDFRPDEGQGIPPILSGFAEGNRSAASLADDQERIAVYRKIEREMNDGPEAIWKFVGEIDLSFPRSVNIRIANTVVNVHVGEKDFRNRFQTALDVLAAAKRGDRELLSRYSGAHADRLIRSANDISSVNAADKSGRIVFGFSSPATEAKEEKKPPQAESKPEAVKKQEARSTETKKGESGKQEPKPASQKRPGTR